MTALDEIAAERRRQIEEEGFDAAPAPSSREAPMRGERLTAAQRDMLRRAVRSATGNPWPSMSIRERSGGAKQRMFEKMQARGWFDLGNCITPAGREAIGMKEGEDV